MSKNAKRDSLLFVDTTDRICAKISPEVQRCLTRNKMLVVKIQHPRVEGFDYPVFSKNITLVKGVYEKGVKLVDAPDLLDLIQSPLPWMGETTILKASRQFRSRNYLAVHQDVVLRFGNELYHLSDASISGIIPRDTQLGVYLIRNASHLNLCETHTCIQRMDLNDVEIQSHTSHEMPLSEDFKKFMEYFDFKVTRREGVSYIFEAGTDNKVELLATRYGAVIEV